MTTIDKETCPTCGQSVNERQIVIFKGMVEVLWDIYKWCLERNVHEFERTDIKHFFHNETISARFGDIIYFGGLVYKNSKAHYGLNMERCEEFFANRLAIPTIVTRHPIHGVLAKYEPKLRKEIPHLMAYLDEDLKFIARYGAPKQVQPIDDFRTTKTTAREDGGV